MPYRDGRPVWGGTYFKKEQWVNALEQIATLYANHPEKLEEYATKLEQGLKAMDVININTEAPDFDSAFVNSIVKDWSETL
ncbi:hypothetical protein [Lacinutrix neustonica]|uniref:hypothetical protein n=1 Tax=Lacinutrix neustonica TaxID=2980107 RepID=UPI0028BD244C|nr:hypothetical protein [Lacinutrix neustonica]